MKQRASATAGQPGVVGVGALGQSHRGTWETRHGGGHATKLKLIRMWLEAPIEEDDGHGGKKVSRSGKGTPQGGVISPLLANVYLHWFEKVFHASDGPSNWANAKIVRYADDFMVLARYQGSRLAQFVETKIESWLGLELNRDKTEVVDLQQSGASVDFLGYTFRYDRDLRGHGHRYLNVAPSRKAMREMNWYVRSRLIGHLRRRSHRPFRLPKGQSYYHHLQKLGLIYM